MNIIQKPLSSHNYDEQRFGYQVEVIVIHIAEGSKEGCYSWFNNGNSQVSAHYIVNKDNTIWQFLPTSYTAWHAGYINQPTSSFVKSKGNINPNLYTIGIEHEGWTGHTWSESQFEQSAQLVASLCMEYNIPCNRERIITHAEINSIGRKNCPGSGVDMNKLVERSREIINNNFNQKNMQHKIDIITFDNNNESTFIHIGDSGKIYYANYSTDYAFVELGGATSSNIVWKVTDHKRMNFNLYCRGMSGNQPLFICKFSGGIPATQWVPLNNESNETITEPNMLVD